MAVDDQSRNYPYAKSTLDGKSHPVVRKAQAAVHRALRRGKLTRPSTCDRCQKSGRLEAHHEDYSRPLHVAWLCSSCHQKRHHEMGRLGVRLEGL